MKNIDGIDGRTQRFPPKLTPAEFWDNTTRIPYSGCWIWLKSHDAHPYGSAHVQGVKETITSRVAVVLTTGKRIPYGKYVLHRCDVKGCINPAHLEIGSAKKNARDAWARGLRLRKWTHPYPKVSPVRKRRAAPEGVAP